MPKRNGKSAADAKDRSRVNARPTKEFFIDMLTRDIRLVRCIIDLADNSVDGARRIRPSGNYRGLDVRLETTSEQFRIADNCGGIDANLARDYAFRFGRPKGTPRVEHSVGQFGVGMKRALFKLGNRFRVESTWRRSRFVIDVDVEQWQADPDPDWQFEFSEIDEDSTFRKGQRGTIITVTELHDSVAAEFRSSQFETLLASELQHAQLEPLQSGLAITLNGLPLDVEPLTLLTSDEIKPALRTRSFDVNGSGPVTARLYAGIADSEPEEAGWYIFCNGRLVLAHDQTGTTGWGENRERTIPKYHNQFARFRGYTFLDSDDPGLLPWNTTKTGVDADSRIYKAVRLEMVSLMRPVIDFLNRLKEEREGQQEETDAGPLEELVDAASGARLAKVDENSTFDAPRRVKSTREPETGRIQYNKPLAEIKEAKRALKVSTQRAVGERTFDYFYERECAE